MSHSSNNTTTTNNRATTAPTSSVKNNNNGIVEETWNVLLQHDNLIKHFQAQLKSGAAVAEVQAQVLDMLLLYNQNTSKLIELQATISGLLLKKTSNNNTSSSSSPTTVPSSLSPATSSSTATRAKSPLPSSSVAVESKASTGGASAVNAGSASTQGGHGKVLPKPPGATTAAVSPAQAIDPFFSVPIAPIVTSVPTATAATAARQSPTSPAPAKVAPAKSPAPVVPAPLIEDPSFDIFTSNPATAPSPKPASPAPIPAAAVDVDVLGGNINNSKKQAQSVNEFDAFLGDEKAPEMMLEFGEDSSKLTRQLKILNLFDEPKESGAATNSPATTLDAMFE